MGHGVILINICVKNSSVWTSPFLFKKEANEVVVLSSESSCNERPNIHYER